MSKLTSSGRVPFMIRGYVDTFLPSAFYSLDRVLNRLSADELAAAQARADYYCSRPLQPVAAAGDPRLLTASEFRLPRSKPRHSTYFFPVRNALNYFPKSVRFLYAPGDIYDSFDTPTLAKARCVGDENAALLPLNAIRHFRYVDNDPTPWADKLPCLVMRNEVHRSERKALMERWFGHERTNLGQINREGGNPQLWLRPRMTVDEQLQYKFIACIEGNDVATNLKWVMSSNSLPVMPRPTMESWFMEVRLQPGVHYVDVADDYSDLIERMDFFIQHPDRAQAMIEANHRWIRQFQDPRIEKATTLLTMRNYLAPQL